jgi:hypothetical protein
VQKRKETDIIELNSPDKIKITMIGDCDGEDGNVVLPSMNLNFEDFATPISKEEKDVKDYAQPGKDQD